MLSFIASARLRAFVPPSGKVALFMAAACLFQVSAAAQATIPTAHYSGAQIPLPNGAQFPYGMAVDKSGNIFITDYYAGTVSEVSNHNGFYKEEELPLGSFQLPWGIAVDTSDNLYIVEAGGHDVIKETLTPTPNGPIYTRSVLPTIGLYYPFGIALDAAGNVYIDDQGNGRIVKDRPLGNTYIQSTVAAGLLGIGRGIAVDAGGSVYVTDGPRATALKYTPSGAGYTQSTVAARIPSNAFGVAVDGSGNVFIIYSLGRQNPEVLEESPAGNGYVESTVAFPPERYGPYSVASDAGSNVYLAFSGDEGLLKSTAAAGDFGAVDTGGVSVGTPISLMFVFDSPGTLGSPEVLTQGLIGLDFRDAGSGSCTTQGAAHFYNAGDSCNVDVTFRPQFPGLRRGAARLRDATGKPVAVGYVYGVGAGPQAAFPPGRQAVIDSGFGYAQGLAVDAGGNLFVVASESGILYKETSSGNVFVQSVVAAGFDHPKSVAVDGTGNLYVAAADGLYQETPLAGSYAQKALITNLSNLAGVAVDGGGNLYLTSSTSENVHKETLANGMYSEVVAGLGISQPGGVAVDGIGTIYVADPLQGAVYVETPEADGSYRQTTAAAGLAGPQGVAVDGGGNLYITGSGSGEVYREAPDGNGGYVQSIAHTGLDAPWGIGADGRGNLYLSLDTPSGGLTMIDVAGPPILNFAKTQVGSTSKDSPQLVTLANIGNETLSVYANPSITPGFRLGAATTCPVAGSPGTAGSVAVGGACGYAINFMPVAPGPMRGSLTLIDDSLNALAAQRLELRRAIFNDATRTTLRVSPDPLKLSHEATITATVTDTSVLSKIPQGGVTFTDTVSQQTVMLNGGEPVPLSGGQAILRFIPHLAGEHMITAHYDGVNASFAGSTGVRVLTVYKASPGASQH